MKYSLKGIVYPKIKYSSPSHIKPVQQWYSTTLSEWFCARTMSMGLTLQNGLLLTGYFTQKLQFTHVLLTLEASYLYCKRLLSFVIL